jgi:hypothetical protein
MRRGVSLLEVLFAIGVVTIGLLGALALLPAAASQARKGRINDDVAVLAPRAVHEFDARGYRNVVNWMSWNTVANDWRQHTPGFGESICIDPRFIAANASTPIPAKIFPYVPPIGSQVRMQRITLSRGDGVEMSKILADSIFSLDDDIASIRPDDASLAAQQRFDMLPSQPNVRARRLSEGHYSWMATLTPKVNRYTGSYDNDYVLTVVVFRDRPADLSINDAKHERVVDVTFPGGGYQGGEVLLSSATVDLSVKSGDWIMLMARTRTGNFPVFRWYRVSDTEAEPDAGQRYVTLIGQDWDADPVTGNLDNQALLMDGVVGVYEKTVRLR